jgi:hypothetical protein
MASTQNLSQRLIFLLFFTNVIPNANTLPSIPCESSAHTQIVQVESDIDKIWEKLDQVTTDHGQEMDLLRSSHRHEMAALQTFHKAEMDGVWSHAGSMCDSSSADQHTGRSQGKLHVLYALYRHMPDSIHKRKL